MTEEFYASIKLVSGEELFAITSAEEHTLILQDPVCIQPVHGPRGSFIRVEPWMHVPNDQFFFIDKDKVITMTETKDERLIDIYTSYINDDDTFEMSKPSDKPGKTKPSKRMGYVSSVEDARKTLEDIFKLDIKES